MKSREHLIDPATLFFSYKTYTYHDEQRQQ